MKLNENLNETNFDSQEEGSSDDDYEPGVDIVMFSLEPRVPPQFANIESQTDEAKKFIPTLTLEPISQVFVYIPQLNKISL